MTLQKPKYGHKDNNRTPPLSEFELDLLEIIKCAKMVGHYESDMNAEHTAKLIYPKLKYYREKLAARKLEFERKYNGNSKHQ